MSQSKLDTSQRKALRKLLRVAETIRGVHKEMEIQQLITLLNIMLSEDEATVSDLTQKVGISMSSVSRHVIDFSDLDRSVNGVRRDGMNLLSMDVNPLHRSQKIIKMKPKGKKLINDLTTAMED